MPSARTGYVLGSRNYPKCNFDMATYIRRLFRRPIKREPIVKRIFTEVDTLKRSSILLPMLQEKPVQRRGIHCFEDLINFCTPFFPFNPIILYSLPVRR
jgi:hypothetical protein